VPQASTAPAGGRLLPWIAAERTFRALLVFAAGIVLLTHPHTDWGAEISHAARSLGLDPNSNWVRKLTDEIKHVSAREEALFGGLALVYAGIEGTEAYGLWRRRRWGEWLTVIATAIFLLPEVWELTKRVTPLKAGGFVVNLAVVAYLIWRLRHEGAREHRPARPR
jgi:uncharacterized membrane protein (DUF2068 family)